MDQPISHCGRTFSPALIAHLQGAQAQTPVPSHNHLAREVCAHLAWYSPDGRPAVASAKVALHKLRRRGLLPELGARPLTGGGSCGPPADPCLR